MKKLLVLVAVFVFAGWLFAAAPAKKAAAQKPAAVKAEIVVIESEEYEAGQEDPLLTAGLGQFFGSAPKVTKMSVSAAKQDPKLAGFDYSFLPLYLIKKTPAVREKMAEPLAQGFVQENNDFIILAHQTRQGVYPDKPAQKGVMEVFVMSQCPYGVRAEDLIIKAKKEGKFPADKELKIRYIVDYDPVRGFNSLHGSGEWEENVRQLLIAKYYPEKFWKYLEIRNKDYRSSRWDKAMEEAGINTKKIMKKFDTEGLELLKAEAAYSKANNISASPSLLWEGKVQLGLDYASKISGFEFFNPQAAAGVPAVPSGSC